MPIRHARSGDLAAIVAIYNASVAGRMATADLEPVSVASREGWFRGFSERHRPLWVACERVERTARNGAQERPRVRAQRQTVTQPVAWLSLHSFYGRPAYDATVEVSVYCAPAQQHRGHARALLRHAAAAAPALGISTFLGYVFGHNAPSLALFESEGFARWGRLPGIATLDGIRRDLVILGRSVDTR